MLAVISPAKSLDFSSPLATRKNTQPAFQKESTALIKTLRQLGPADLSALMGISTKLADLNYQRYADWEPQFTDSNARPAALAFAGDVYHGLQAGEYSERDFNYAQKHLRILSGLHGLLRPLDLIQPYRLEMGTRLETDRGTDLYAFWGSRVTTALNAALAESGTRFLINLASQEYFGVLQPQSLNGRLINVQFKDFKNGSYKFMSFYGKQARGLMASYIIQQRVSTLKALRAFDWQGYYFSEDASTDDDWVFRRDSVPEG